MQQIVSSSLTCKHIDLFGSRSLSRAACRSSWGHFPPRCRSLLRRVSLDSERTGVCRAATPHTHTHQAWKNNRRSKDHLVSGATWAGGGSLGEWTRREKLARKDGKIQDFWTHSTLYEIIELYTFYGCFAFWNWLHFILSLRYCLAMHGQNGQRRS